MPVQQTMNNGLHTATNFGQGVFKKSRGFLQDFKDFINKGNAFDLAVAFILSAALAAVIKSLVEDIITPLFGLANNRNLDEMFVVLRCGSTCTYNTRALAQADGAVTWNWGRFINSIIYLILIGFFLFIIVKLYYGMRRKVQVKDKACPYCCKDVNGTAARCPHCTSWLEIDVQRRVEGEYIDSKTNSNTGERSLSTTTLGTSNGVLKEKGSMEMMNDSKKMGAGAGAAVGSGAVDNVYNNNNNNSIVSGNNMNNGYMSNQHNLYTNPLPGQLQGQRVYDGTGVSQIQDQRNYDGMGVSHQSGYDGMGVNQPPAQRGYDGMGVSHQNGHGGLGVDHPGHSEGEGEHETGHGTSSLSKPKASSSKPAVSSSV
ncbi:MAG: large-conductance mechanosensitive channel [Linnemannia gamsii]|nr:MAG: large-conductance mechanosensitive channel [Linnemannia gamsii]